MSDAEAQEDEIMALDSIYENVIFTCQTGEDGRPEGQFAAHLDLPQPFVISVGANKGDCQEVHHLPPVVLLFQLPSDYPSTRPPCFTLSCKWLTKSQLSRLCKHLDELWEENQGEVVLFLWTSFLKDECADFLGIKSPLDLSSVVEHRTKRKKSKADCSDTTDNIGAKDTNKLCDTNSSTDQESQSNDGDQSHDPRAVQDIASQSLLLPTLLEHNKDQHLFVFRTTLFTCQVCFQEKLGELCLQFTGCNHVYCKECMKGYFEIQINDGSVKCLTCPSNKCESQAHPAQVKELVSAELFARYDRLLLQSSLDTMADIMYCPRKACACAVMVDNNVGSCPMCNYVFCIYCKMVYHGVSPCKIKADEVKKLRDEFVNATEAHKKLMEKRYGRKVITHIIEDSFTQDWLAEYSKQCPHCGTHIQKVDGCNKMTCTKCRSYFCWLCMASLSRGDPYSHFNSTSSKCFNQLFQGVVMNDNDDDDEEEEWEPMWI